MTSESPIEKPAFWTEPERRVPRIALMGEFSAGKSTLANLMIGTDPLPVQVVATQLPPVWITYGSDASVIVDLKGQETPCDINTLHGLSPEETAFIKFSCEEEILTQCDIVDMPGISDPNMASTVWERMLPYTDAVVWCTPATQAWRQSEAAVWLEVEQSIREKSILVITRADMLLSEQDRSKVLKRIKAETKGMFADVVMMSLTQAQNVENNEDLWVESGADVFVAAFMNMVSQVQAGLSGHASPTHSSAEDMSGATGGAQGSSTSRVMPRRPAARNNDTSASSARAPDAQNRDASVFVPKFS